MNRGSSHRWLARQRRDPYVQQARRDGYRSRAAYKLLELDAKDRLLRPGARVVDLGAAPGGWSQVAAARVRPGGLVVALDLLPMAPLPGVAFVQGDFREEETLARLLELVPARALDLVLSDLAPNVSGLKAVDGPRMSHLAELTFELACQTLKPGGCLLLKTFHGEGFDALVKALRTRFEDTRQRKPPASRAESREVYLVAKNFRVL